MPTHTGLEEPTLTSATSKFTFKAELWLRNVEIQQIGAMIAAAWAIIDPEDIIFVNPSIRGQFDDTPPETETPPPANALNAAIRAKDQAGVNIALTPQAASQETT